MLKRQYERMTEELPGAVSPAVNAISSVVRSREFVVPRGFGAASAATFHSFLRSRRPHLIRMTGLGLAFAGTVTCIALFTPRPWLIVGALVVMTVIFVGLAHVTASRNVLNSIAPQFRTGTTLGLTLGEHHLLSNGHPGSSQLHYGVFGDVWQRENLVIIGVRAAPVFYLYPAQLFGEGDVEILRARILAAHEGAKMEE